jgi:hypothetical protein
MSELLRTPELTCPNCGEKIQWHSPITESGQEIKKGLILVCAECSTFCVLGDSNLKRMTVKQFKALPQETKKLMGITRYRLDEERAKRN